MKPTQRVPWILQLGTRFVMLGGVLAALVSIQGCLTYIFCALSIYAMSQGVPVPAGMICYPSHGPDRTAPPTCGSNSWDDPDGDGMSNETENENGSILYQVGSDFFSLDPFTSNPNPSRALGTARDGPLSGGLKLPNQTHLAYESCGGYKIYVSPTERPDGENWGTATLVRLIEDVSRSWASPPHSHVYPHMRVGDMSLRDGRAFDGHTEHGNGRSVDMRYVGTGSYEDNLNFHDGTEAYYSQSRTQALVGLFAADGRVEQIWVDPDANLTAGPKISLDTTGGHFNHFHVRITDPDGTSNSPAL